VAPIDYHISATPLGLPDFDVPRERTYVGIIDLQRFDSTLGDAATLDVLWTVRLAGSGKLRGGRSAVREAAGVDGYDALVAAHARALASVSRDIAQAIDALRTARWLSRGDLALQRRFFVRTARSSLNLVFRVRFFPRECPY